MADAVVETEITKPGFGTFLSIYFRSFFIQGSFSQKYRQNSGFLFCINPVGRLFWKSPAEYNEFCERHLEYYNGNPFMITLVLGAVTRIEEDLRTDKVESAAMISGFKKAVGAATGSVGDRLFWSSLRPLALLLGLFLTYLFGVAGIITVLLLFNLPSAILRWHWLMRGYKLGINVIGEIKNEKLQKAENIIGGINALVLGFMTVNLTGLKNEMFPGYILATIILFILGLALYKRNYSVSFVVLLTLGLIVLSGLIRFYISV